MSTQTPAQGEILRFDLDFDGYSHRNMTAAALVAAGVSEARVLQVLKVRLAQAIDERAEDLRARLLSPGVGQAMEYLEVQAQAFAALAKPTEASADRFPMLAASIGLDIDPETGATAADVLGVARSIRAAYDAWNTAGAAIRKVRLSAKAAIAAATTLAEAEAAASPSWPAPT